MSDGANFGVSADRALKTILSGEDQPTEEERTSPEETLIRVAIAKADTYEGCADTVARAVLRTFMADPQTRTWPAERSYRWILKTSGEEVHDLGNYNYDELEAQPQGPDLYALTKSLASKDEFEAMTGMTGFQWGFAVNCARYILGMLPAANPALFTVTVPDA